MRRCFALLLLLLLLSPMPATAQPATPAWPDLSPYTGNYAGRVDGTAAFLAVVIDRQHHVLAYVCDGATLARWFTGAVALDGRLDVRAADGTRLVATLGPDGLTGTLTLDETGHAATLAPVTAPAGLYRAEAMIAGTPYVGGWIELASGEVRGAVLDTETGVVGQDLDLARPDNPVDGFIGQNIGF